MTNQSVSIYIGSSGNPKNSLHFKIGLLDVWLRYNPFWWVRVWCIHSTNQISINKQIIFVLVGLLAPFAIAVVTFYFAFAYDFHGFIKLILVMFILNSILDIGTSLMSNNYYEDNQLKLLFYEKRFSTMYEKAIEPYNQKQFEKAAILLKEMLQRGFKEKIIYELAIASFLQTRNYEQAKKLAEEFISKYEVGSDSYSNIGLIYSKLSEHEIALEYYDKSLQLNPTNQYPLYNKGFTFLLLNKFEDAISLFDKVIEINKESGYSYANRGLAKIKIGKTEEGLEDINYSLKLDENNEYAYRNLGIYHLDKGDFLKALELFKKAKELDNATYEIDELINKAEQEQQEVK